jgi:hypothetical protein
MPSRRTKKFNLNIRYLYCYICCEYKVEDTIIAHWNATHYRKYGHIDQERIGEPRSIINRSQLQSLAPRPQSSNGAEVSQRDPVWLDNELSIDPGQGDEVYAGAGNQTQVIILICSRRTE